jgi:fibronectin-binding autotransporter adhesin
VLGLTKLGIGTLFLTDSNSYSGPTTVRAGTLSVGTLANAGVSSSIGAYATAAAGGLVINQGATLDYTGETATIDRGFTFNATSTSGKLNLGNATDTALTMGELLFVAGTSGANTLVVNATSAGSSLNLGKTTITAGNNVQFICNIPLFVKELVAATSAGGVSPNFNNTGSGSTTVESVTTTITNANVCVGGASGTITTNVSIGTGQLLKAGGATWTFLGTNFVAGSLGINGATGGFTVGGSSTLNNDINNCAAAVPAVGATYPLLGNQDATTNGYTLGVQPTGVRGYLAVNGTTLVYVVDVVSPTISGYGPLSGTSFPVTFSGPSGQTYKVLTGTNGALPLASWTVLTAGTFTANPETYTDTSATNAQRFYRIQSP